MKLLLSVILSLFVALVIFCCDDSYVHYSDASDFYLDSIPETGARIVDANRWRLWLQPDGRWGYDPKDLDQNGNTAGGEFPKGSGQNAMYAGGLYVGALKNGISTVSQIEFSSEFLPGRILNTEPTEVNKLKFSNPNSSAIYIITEPNINIDWQFWPSQWGAPVDDHGEPLQLSMEDSWCVFHDLGADTLDIREQQTNRALGLEVQRRTYMFEYLGTGDAFFVHFKITNKSSNQYPEAYVSLWCDKDLEEPHNDLIGTDIPRNMVVVYNSNDGQTITGREYAIGYKFLYFTEGGIHANLSSTNWYQNGTDPTTDLRRYNLQKGFRQDGTFNEGLDSLHGGFVYPGDPITGQGVLDTFGENGRIMLNVGPFTMQAGASYDFVCVVIGGEADTRMNAILDLRKKADQIEDYFNLLMVPAMKLNH